MNKYSYINTFTLRKYVVFQQSNFKSGRLFAVRKDQIERINSLEKEYGTLNQIPSREIIDCHELIYIENENRYILEPDKRVITPINRLEYQDSLQNVS